MASDSLPPATLTIRVERPTGSAGAERAALQAGERLRGVLGVLGVAVEVSVVTGCGERVSVAGQPLDAWLPAVTIEADADGELIERDGGEGAITSERIAEAGLRAASELLDAASAPPDCPGTHCGRCCGGRCRHGAA
jgi:hypothetical protein